MKLIVKILSIFYKKSNNKYFYYFRSNLLLQLTPKNDLYEKLLSAKEKIFKKTKLNKTLDFESCFTSNTKSKIFKFFKNKIFNELDLIGIEQKINSKFNAKNNNKRADILKSEVPK